jgi:hypothetical protein
MSSSLVGKTTERKMRNFDLKNTASFSSLLAVLVAAGCSTGSGTPAGGTAGTSASGGAGTTAATGTAGTSASGGAGTTAAGTAGTTASGTAGTGVTGTGGTGITSTGAAGSVAENPNSVCAGAGTRPLTIDQGGVANFEEDPISPGWSSFNNLLPAAPDNSIKIVREAGGAVGTGFFGHYMGTGAVTPLKGGFGVGVVYNMAIDHTAMIYCVDVSAFDGVTFWAKAGTAGAHVGVNFVIPETNEKPDGDCPGPTGCFNHPMKLITLTTDWAQYSVAFSAAAGGTAKVTNRIQQLGWLSPDSNWDYSLDEIQLYKGTPPTTAVVLPTP